MPWPIALLTLTGSILVFVGLLVLGGRSVGARWREFLQLWTDAGRIMLFILLATGLCYGLYRWLGARRRGK